MKKRFAIITLMALFCLLTACGKEKSQPATLGGWSVTDSADVTVEAREAFEKALDGLVGVKYEPIALLGDQIVSGTNRCFLCEASVVYPNARPYYSIVTVYTDAQGNSTVKNIVALDLGKIMESGEIVNSDAPAGQQLGGWSVDRESDVKVDGAVMHIASQVVSGKNHCVLCKGWTLTFVYENTEGKTEVLKTVPLDLAALSQTSES